MCRKVNLIFRIHSILYLLLHTVHIHRSQMKRNRLTDCPNDRVLRRRSTRSFGQIAGFFDAPRANDAGDDNRNLEARYDALDVAQNGKWDLICGELHLGTDHQHSH